MDQKVIITYNMISASSNHLQFHESHLSTFSSYDRIQGPRPSCSKLTTSLVNDSLKITSSDRQIC